MSSLPHELEVTPSDPNPTWLEGGHHTSPNIPCGRKRNKLVLGAAIVAILLITITLGASIGSHRKRQRSINHAAAGSDSVQQTNQDEKSFSDESAATSGTTSGEIGTGVTAANRFFAQLPNFDSSIMDPYESCAALEVHIQDALKQLADATIDQGVLIDPTECSSMFAPLGTYFDWGSVHGGGKVQESIADGSVPDVVKSNNEFAFAVYGNFVVMMDMNGVELDRVELPLYWSKTEGLLLDNDSKTLIVLAFEEDTILKHVVGGGNTTAFLYNFANDNTKLELIDSVTMRGRFTSGRMVGSKAHVFTRSFVYTSTFIRELWRCGDDFSGMTNEEYELASFRKALNIIEQYSNEIMHGLGLMGQDEDGNSETKCARIAQIFSRSNQEQTGLASMLRSAHEPGSSYEDENFPVTFFVQINSFDVSQMGEKSPSSSSGLVRTTGAFLPTKEYELYVHDNFAVIAERGRRQIFEKGYLSWSDCTFLMSFDLANQNEDQEAAHRGVAEVKGHVRPQSINSHDGYLQLATISAEEWGKVPGNENDPEDNGDNENDNDNDEWIKITESAVAVYKLGFDPKNKELSVVGQMTDLAATETISAMRFFGERGYIMTWEDMIYVVSTEGDVTFVNQLKRPHLAPYLRPIGSNDEYLLVAGLDVYGEGGSELTVSILEVADSRELPSYVVDQMNGQAQWDYDAFHFLEESQKLVLPVSTEWPWSPESFDGFMVLDVDVENGIRSMVNITHATHDMIENPGDQMCFSAARLPARSKVWNGNLITFKGHSVKLSGDFSTFDEKWTMNLDQERLNATELCSDY